jgi:hypothetical protein
MANPYTIQLLNDLHNHFPEVLYNHNRFRSVGELLTYVNDIVRTTPQHQVYHYYHQQYHAHYHPQYTHQIYNELADDPMRYQRDPLLEEPRYVPRREAPVAPVAAPEVAPIVEEPRNYIIHFRNIIPLSNLISQFLQGEDMDQFLDLDNVPVVPTEEHLRANTKVTQLEADHDDACAICQDPMKKEQEVRTLTHCQHMFHMDCIDIWFRQNIQCPCCRHDIREE